MVTRRAAVREEGARTDVSNGGTVTLAEMRGDIGTKLEAARKDLLDLGLRNPLLNYRLLRARGVEVVDELSAEIFRILVRQGKQMSFLAVPDGQAGGILAQPEETNPAQPAARHTDTRLQTNEPSTKLQSRLLATYHAARISIEEQGVNTLFLALGMVHWYEARDAGQVRRAPLILIPVGLERADAASRFHVKYNGEEIGPNLSLMEKLKWEFGITMPPMPDAEDLDIAGYFAAVKGAIRSEPNWKIASNEIALGFFSFAKLLMFKDLDPATWPDGQKPTEHPLMRSLLGEAFHDGPSSFSENDNLDARPESAALHPVMDADSSQTLAILDVQSGRNLVIQGPPGTGKSQTITNLIAEAIATDKKVLFVAEKLAALEVVKRRLDRVGLGDACLELHSHNTQKKALLQELRRTLDLGRPRPTEGMGDRARLQDTRDRLNDYCRAVNAPMGESGVSPYRALGELTSLQQRYPKSALVKIDLPTSESWDAATYPRLESKIAELQASVSVCGVPSTHPFRGSKRTILLPTEEQEIRRVLNEADEATNELEKAAVAVAEALGKEAPRSLADLVALHPRPWQVFRTLFGKDKKLRAPLQAAELWHSAAIEAVIEVLDLDEKAQFGDATPLADRSFEEQQTCLACWLDALPSLGSLAIFNAISTECHASGLGTVVDHARTWGKSSTDLVATFRFSWFTALLERAYKERSALARFNRATHEVTLAEFKKLDGLLPGYNSTRIAEAHWERLPQQHGGGQLAVLKREFEKKTRHMPIRQLMVKAGIPIQAIKPVFMMSPLSIANYLPPGSVEFDLVIFDEASQVRPVDAFGALLRGGQAVVVGDSKQLPPTSFFDTLARGDEEIEDDSVTSDIESVLGLFAAQLAPERMLRWHYRSRHESLITVSNHAFYNDRLVVFPSPDAARENVGLVYHHLPESAYDRGRTRTNPLEAEAVAHAVMEHARTQPHLSLGVAAFSVAQMEAIEYQIELLRRQNPECEDFFTSAHPHERFFVKNLETVQGDERDVIYISIGYGRTAEGYLAMSFGPLNGDGGERRLNVLITRARVRCEVFTNLTADDIAADGKGAGVYALKTFLQYAQKGILDVPTGGDGEVDSPFEEAVFYELSRRGHKVKKQVGAAGFRIDLAIVDPDHEGRYLLGVECDGASYHSARSARDRDRLRQQVLENLGWRIHRIWSTDWFRDPGGEMNRLQKSIKAAQKSSSAPVPSAPPTSDGTVQLRRENVPSLRSRQFTIPLYTTAGVHVNMQGRELHTVSPNTMATWVTRVVEAESPVHRTEVARRIADSAGVQRVGSRIEATVNAAIDRAERSGEIRVREDFLWTPSMQHAPIRDRSALPASSRKFQLIAPEEIDSAICRVVGDALGISADDVPPSMWKLLGFPRVSEEMRAHAESRLESCLRVGRIVRQNGYLALASGTDALSN